MTKTLKRAVYLDGFLLKAGTELTDEQAERITNPHAYEDEPDRTGPDANDAREYQNIVRAEDDGAALRGKKPAADEQDAGDRAAAGAKLARGKAADRS
jgi:hypothetical protein